MRGLNEGAAHVGVFHHALAVRNTGFLRVADRGGRSRFGRGNHEVGFNGMFAREFTAHLDAGFVDALPIEVRVGARKVDVLEHAALARGFTYLLAAQAVLVDRNELTRGDLAHETRAADVERGSFGGHHPPV